VTGFGAKPIVAFRDLNVDRPFEQNNPTTFDFTKKQQKY
jgi:hypothetical protein